MSELRVTVEKNVPCPEKAHRARWPFSWMEVGDSFAVPSRWYASISASVSGYWNKRGKRFVIRKVNGEYRCWRIE